MTAPHDRHDSPENIDEPFVAEGLRAGASLDAAHLVLVLGNDTRLTALAALGVARAQSGRRRVALGDLLGDAEPILELLDGGDPHGLADSFVYGVSLNKIARAVPKYGELYVLPSGSEVPAYEEIFTNARWRRISAGFRETGALLVVAAPASAAHVTDVIALADGAILVGDAEVPGLDDSAILARVQPPAVSVPNEVPAAVPAEAAAAAPDAEPLPALEAEPTAFSDRPRPWWRRLPVSPAAAAAGVVLAVALAAMGVWLAARPLAGRNEAAAVRRRSTSTAAGTVPSTLDSLRADSAMPRDSATLAALTPANPADSSGAAAYGVVLARFNTQAGAIFWLQKEGPDLPSATFAPTLVQGATWYRAIAGSYAASAQADSLLAALRLKGQLRGDLGEVVRLPYAFLVDSVSGDAVSRMLKYFADRGQPVYALRQPDGSARLYAGAFETPQQAALFIDAVRTSGIRPVLVYRSGRVY